MTLAGTRPPTVDEYEQYELGHRKEKPDLIISCGAAVAVPFFYIGKMMGAKLVYIEVFDRIDKPTMTGSHHCHL